MLRFPENNPDLDKLYDRRKLEAMVANHCVPHVKECIESAQAEFENPSLKRLSYVARKGNNDVVLIEIKRTMTRKELWNFGQ